jgi:hypothetical protein
MGSRCGLTCSTLYIQVIPLLLWWVFVLFQSVDSVTLKDLQATNAALVAVS